MSWIEPFISYWLKEAGNFDDILQEILKACVDVENGKEPTTGEDKADAKPTEDGEEAKEAEQDPSSPLSGLSTEQLVQLLEELIKMQESS